MVNNTTNATGLPPLTIQARNGGTPGEANFNTLQQRNLSQANANGAIGGSKKKKGGALTVVQVPGDTSGANGVLTKVAGTSAQNQQDAIYDNLATQKGGKRGKKGGNPDWLWGCYSGGKKRKSRTNKRKTRRHRKKTRRNKK
jgi:hypothetical protein